MIASLDVSSSGWSFDVARDRRQTPPMSRAVPVFVRAHPVGALAPARSRTVRDLVEAYCRCIATDGRGWLPI